MGYVPAPRNNTAMLAGVVEGHTALLAYCITALLCKKVISTERDMRGKRAPAS